MQLTSLGPLAVSRVGLGCNAFGGRIDAAATRRVVDAALDAGVSFFDTADIYGNRSGATVYGNLGGSERALGRALRGRRDTVVLATKFGGDMGGGDAGGDPAYVRRALDASLTRLRTDHVDLLYYHRPDGITPITETVAAMAELVAAGKTRAIGLSNVTTDDLRAAAETAQIAAVQNEYSLLARGAEHAMLPRCRDLGVGFVPYYPLAGGLLTGKYRAGRRPPAGSRLSGDGELVDGSPVTPSVSASFATLDRLRSFAAERGHTLLELAIAAVACQPGVASVIAGATSPDQVRANAAAADWDLTPDHLAELAAVTA